MGIILSRLRAKPSTKDLLEDLEKEIEAHEEYKRSTEQQHKKVVGSLIFYFILLFILGSAIFLLYYYPTLTTTKEKCFFALPILAFPVVFIILRRFLHWYFTQKIKYNEENLSQLKRRRRSLLEYAMETETYKVVKELLEKYDPDYYRRVFESTPAIEAPPPSAPPFKGSFGEVEFKRRTPPSKTATASSGQNVQMSNAAGSAQIFPFYPSKSPTNPPFRPPIMIKNSQQFARPPMQSMPRPVLPRERNLVDRLVDYLVGDGPSNRYALICRQCHSHNGMALKEEFEFVAFRCCYCFHWNPPRNQQPPRLPLPAPSSTSSSSEEGTTELPPSTDETSKVEEIQEDGVVHSPPSPIVLKSASESPTLRRRLVSNPEEEISAVLEEDRTSNDNL